MFKIILTTILISQVGVASESAWEAARAKPTGYLNISGEKRLTQLETQISCEHLRFRYKELEKILKDINWIFSTNNSEANGKHDAHAYIKNRLQADPRPIASHSAYELKINLPKDLLKKEENPIDAIAILGATNFDLLLATTNSGVSSSLEELENNLILTAQINTYDICGKKYLEIFLLRKCPKDEIETASLTYNFQSCEDIQSFRVNLNSFEGKLGLRKREIKRDTK